ncbi:MAG TPA: sarcosine oxidase subunit alpha family protein [Stellaceae bacterium]|nr:sarcosine oxidase subunit alpha family protein [Stellaceae bacterium]
MSGRFRLRQGGRIDRARPLRFTFDGTSYEGFAGDTLASALLANGVHLVGRSFKYHRPRGILAAGSDEPNALVGIGGHEARYTPNLRATQVELYDGLVAESQNRWPSLRFDLGAINDLASPLLPAGFYYKTFMWPKSAWRLLYEPKIRAMAGLGRAATAPDGDRYTQRFAHCEVLVVGAGPAGLAAALTAALSGARVIVVDEQSELGGSLLGDASGTVDGVPTQDWLARTLAILRGKANVTLLPRSTAFGYFPHNLIGVAERVTHHLADADPRLPRERLWQIRAAEVVLAAGALERPLAFPDNDRPGILLAGAAQTYVNRYGVRPGTRAVVATAHDAAYQAAIDLAKAGIEIAGIIDLRPVADGPLPAAARAAGLPITTHATVTGTKGRLRVSGVQVATIGADGPTIDPRGIACDLVLMSGGYTPAVHLVSQSKGKLRFDETLNAYVPDSPAERERSAGACRGVFGLADALADGAAAGAAAATAAGYDGVASHSFTAVAATMAGAGFLGATPSNRPTAKAFVDFQNDVTVKDLKLAVREGFRSIEHIKRYTTTGMATDQGKTSNMNSLGVVAEVLGKPIPEIGLTTFRMPYTPVTFGTLAGTSRGELFDPVRATPTHDWAAAQGALFEDVSLWKRAHYFPRAGEDLHAAVARECRAVRDGVGIFDASTLGKIEIVGPDAAEFMNRMYTNSWTKLEPGRCRYGVMLREDGFVMDDGVIGRLAPDRFHVTTTTGGAARVLGMMEDYLQTEWPTLDVWLTSTTEQWAVIAVQGPRARDVLTPLIEGIDIAAAAMPHMSIREGRICGVPTRLFRVSFTGELGFEVNVPADYGMAVWQAILAAGARHGMTPYGTETMHVLRAEKGYIIVGQETDGTATPDDVGLGWAVGKTKPDFVGMRSLARPAMTEPGRKQLVGLLTEDPQTVLEEGAQIVATPNQPVPVPMLGHVTSSYFSACLGHSIALAVIEGGRARIGSRLYVPMADRTIPVTLVEPVFYDKAGERLNG